MTIQRDIDLHLTRRQLFGLTARGIGAAALGSLLTPDLLAAGAALQDTRDPKTGGLTSASALRAEGEARHLPAPVRRAVAARDVRLQAGPREVSGHADPRLRPPGPARRPDDGAVVAAGGEVDVRVLAARAERDVGERAPAAHREDRRRHHPHQDDEHRRDQSRSRHHVHSDRIPAAGPSEHGRVAQLRPRQRESESAGVRGVAVAGARAHYGPAALLAVVGERLPAVELSGRQVPRRRRAGPVSRGPAGNQQDDPAADAGRRRQAQHDAARGVRRSRDRDAHRAVRDGVPDAVIGAGPDRFVEGARFGLRAVRPRIAQARHLRRELSAGAGAWRSATSDSFSSTTAAGISTATSRATSRCSARGPTSRRPRSSPTSSSAGCSTTRSSSGAASSGGRCSVRAS